MPQVLPGNEEIIKAFFIVRNCRNVGMAAGGFDWPGVKTKLELHGLWNVDIERGLDTCECAMLIAEHRERERKTDSSPARARARR